MIFWSFSFLLRVVLGSLELSNSHPFDTPVRHRGDIKAKLFNAPVHWVQSSCVAGAATENFRCEGRDMKGNDPEFLEAARLVRKFFPESSSFIPEGIGLDWDSFLGGMMTANYEADYSCYLFRNSTDPEQGLAQKGGLDGEEGEVYQRLLSHTKMTPSGRAVVILDAIGETGWSTEECPPLICASPTVPKRISEFACFGQSRDTIFVFESGEALLVDHDNRVHWARSNVNQQWRKPRDSE